MSAPSVKFALTRCCSSRVRPIVRHHRCCALLESLEKGHVGGVGLDVYEREEELFFEDHRESGKVHEDQTFARLLALPNVIVTGHQAFLTEEALENIATTTLSNLLVVEKNQDCPNAVRAGA